MTVRVAVDSDASGIAALWNLALPYMRALNLGPRGEITAAEVVRDWLSGGPPQAGSRFYVSEAAGGRLDGFFLVLLGVAVPLRPEPLSPAEQLRIWIVRPLLTSRQKAAVLRDLALHWLKEAIERDAAWGWGTIPPVRDASKGDATSAEESVAFLRAWVPQRITHTWEGQDGWLLFYGSFTEGKARLEAVTF